MVATMSMSQKQLYFYSSKGLSLIKNPDGGASALMRAADLVLGQRDDSQLAFYATDLQGSVLRWNWRNSSSSMEYTVYGWDSRQGASMLQYTGQRKETLTGHYLLGDGYRAYSSELMRFNAPDSLSPFGDGGPNSYCYCTNDPVNKVDPSGHTGLPPNSFLNNSRLFTNRWGLRSAASYTFGQKAPALKTLSVKKGLSEIDPNLKGRIKHAERNQSWKLGDVQRLESATATLQGIANRFELAEKYFATERVPLEAQAAHETRKEILAIKHWVDRKLVKAKEVYKRRELINALPFSQPAEQASKVREGG
ncbi:MAG: RHS repeat-associated core domain-containing protein [Pseudomonas monteilii]|jgi:RHS repeat-associated protein|nr:MAG: RHS repeat-associated core domain-containing protein [Pseudomonas monteilii]